MHEVSLVQGLMAQLLELSRENGERSITCVTVEIGPFSGVVIDSFTFAYEALKEEHEILKGSRLVIEAPEPVFSCSKCGCLQTEGREAESGGHETDDLSAKGDGSISMMSAKICPRCGDAFMVPCGGADIVLKQVEME